MKKQKKRYIYNWINFIKIDLPKQVINWSKEKINIHTQVGNDKKNTMNYK